MNKDLFGNAVGVAPVAAPSRRGPIKPRILEFFKDHKYQSFTVAEVLTHLSSDKELPVRRAIAQLQKSRHVIGTGAFRGSSNTPENLCLTLNLHRR